jgi:antitoxin (DNA-binding transcriptional repressor) of toxin-antitoxin stability system
MRSLNVAQAKAQLSTLLDAVESGEGCLLPGRRRALISQLF